MSDEQPLPFQEPAPSQSPRFIAALPFLVTAVVAVVLSLLLQLAFRPQFAPIASTPLLPTEAAPEAPTASPAAPTTRAAAPQTDERVLGQEVLDLQAENQQLWTVLYLLRSAVQLEDAEAALRNNDFAEVDRMLMTARGSLDKAYEFSAEREKGPIDEFRAQVSRLHDDVRVRPEGMDRRLSQLRQLVLSLVDEGS